ncbi:MAG TPA: patatin-like phospholipase family protein, partial [Polyangiales bacterium]|nr:patatin-like phospholipase family protein [Polyangiales bacterium]
MALARISLATCMFWCSCGLFSSETSVQNIRSAGTDAREAHAGTVRHMIETLAARAKERHDRKLDVLLLSGGGQHGAYAVGFLRGWQERSDALALPAFDLVTGVSSGALQAPFALLGNKAALDRGAALYRDSAVAFARAPDAWLEMRDSQKGVNYGPYASLLEKAIDDDLQKDLQRELEHNRQIAIATTDLDLGALRIWDLGHELGRDEKGLARARALLRASATVPGAAAPVMIDHHVHVSGNVFGSVLIPLELEDYEYLAARLRNVGVSETVEVRLWVVINGFTRAPESKVDPEDRENLAERADALAFVYAQAELVERLTGLAYAVNGSIRGVRMQLRLTAIPSDLVDDPGSERGYDENWMVQLEQVGYDRASGQSAWDRVVSS